MAGATFPAGADALDPAGASRSRNTRLDVLRRGSLGGSMIGGSVLLGRPPASERRSGAPYIFKCSYRISRRFSLSGEISVNSFSAENACSIFPAFCIRSAYCTKFCCASAMKPFAAYSLASLRYVVCRAGALRSTLLHIAIALLWKPSSAYLSTARS